MYIDTHLDTVWHTTVSGRKFHVFEGENKKREKISFGIGTLLDKYGHVDLPRGREGELVIGFFTGFPSSNQYTTEKMVKDWILFMDNPQNQLVRIKTKYELITFIDEWKKSQPNKRKIGSVFALEGAAGIDSELNRLYLLYDIGLRSISLTWNEQNQFATGVLGDKNRGLTREGKDLIFIVEDLGIIIDISHLNDKSFWDVLSTSNSPIIASHSNYRGLANHPRNLTKEMIEAVKDTNGSIGLNLHSGFLSPNKPKKATIDTAVEMLRAMIEIAGTDHVHIGSDFDGSEPPQGIEDVSKIPTFFKLAKEKIGLSNYELEKIQYKNILRIINDVWK